MFIDKVISNESSKRQEYEEFVSFQNLTHQVIASITLLFDHEPRSNRGLKNYSVVVVIVVVVIVVVVVVVVLFVVVVVFVVFVFLLLLLLFSIW